jgi:RNA polymerase sigma-70 factor (ECF subfamily)
MRGSSVESDLESVWASNREYLRRLLTGLTRNADLTEDLLQETYIRAHKGLAGYRGGDIRSWLGKIATNVFYSHARHRSYASECPLDEEAPAVAGFAPGSEAHLSRVQLRKAISALPDALREVLVTKHLSGFTCEEIARRTGCPASTVRWRVHLAMAQLRQALGPSTMPPAACSYLDDTVLLDYLYGTLSPKERARVAAHLDQCTACCDNAGRIRRVMLRLEEMDSTHKIIEMLDLDRDGMPTLYFDNNIMNRSSQPLEHAVFRMNNQSTLLQTIVQGEEAACEHHCDDYFDWDSGRIVRGRYVARLPEPVAPGECLDLLTVSRVHPERSAQQLDDGRFRFRWTQFPSIRWAADDSECAVGYSQAIRLPRGCKLLRVHPLPGEILPEDRTTLIWHTLIGRFAPFECVVEYKLVSDSPEALE